jgi:hypothetical protein
MSAVAQPAGSPYSAAGSDGSTGSTQILEMLWPSKDQLFQVWACFASGLPRDKCRFWLTVKTAD